MDNKIKNQGITSTTTYEPEIKKTRLTVDDLKTDQPIFVYNMSKGDHTLSVRTGDGGVTPITVPKTFIPVQITEQIDPALLKKSEDFRKACFKGVFQIVPNEVAKKVLETREAIIEIERIRKQSNYSGLKYLKSPNENMSILEASKNTNIAVSATVKDILLRDDLTEDDKLASLTTEERLGSLNKQDYEYIISTTETNSKLNKWGSQKLSNLGNKIL